MKQSAWWPLGLLAMVGGVACGPSQGDLDGTGGGPDVSKCLPIPAGTFMMGSDSGGDHEKPVHQVTVAAFCMDRTEVTVAAYEACVKAGKCTPTDDYDYCNAVVPGRESHPINCVDWNQADAYCKAQGLRLPTEEEWEYAARGTDGRTYPWGNEAPSNQLCWDRWGDGKPNSTCAVGAYPNDVSPFGLEDMAANVWELTSSPWTDDYASPPDALYRVNRGGSWFDHDPSGVRSANRFGGEPASRGGTLGFRCAGSSALP